MYGRLATCSGPRGHPVNPPRAVPIDNRPQVVNLPYIFKLTPVKYRQFRDFLALLATKGLLTRRSTPPRLPTLVKLTRDVPMKKYAGVVVCLILPVASAWGQAISTAQITGTVTDTSGLAVPGAEAKATQTATGLVRTITSGADGTYVLTNLPVGPYQLEVKKDGFTTYVQGGIVLQVGSNPTIEVALKVGAVSEQIQVEANANLVETRNSGVGQIIDNQRVLELPLNGRQATELIYLSGIATPAMNTTATQPGGSGINSGIRNYPTIAIAVAGGITNGVIYTLDGGTFNDPQGNLNLPLPFPDALQEFKVQTSALPAQYGHHSSAAVNAVTMSGTNVFHGDAFEFIRNGAVNARNAFSTSVDPLKRNQFGGTFGGPIRRNKLFFFVAEQTTLQRVTPTANIGFVPTPQVLAGDFTTITSAQCNTSGRPITLPAPFVGNKISPALFATPAINIVSLSGFPKTTDPCGQVSFGLRTNNNEYNAVGRTDYQISEKHSLFVRYLAAHFLQPTDADPKNLLEGQTANLDFLDQSVVIGDTYLIGAGTVSSFRATVNRTRVPKLPPPLFDSSQVGINTWVGVPDLLRISITNGFNIGSTAVTPSVFNTLAYQLSEDLSMVRGAHQIGFGVDAVYAMLNERTGIGLPGAFSFTGQVTGLGLADFMTGKSASYSQSNQDLVYVRSRYVGLYAQDAWKATPRLTVSYGVRWDPYLPVTSKSGYISHFDPALFTAGVHTSQYTNAPAGLIYPGDPGYPGKNVGYGRWNNVAPRVALAWDPKGDGRMSVRAAYGVFYDLPALDQYAVFAFSPPFGNSTAVNFPASFANPWAGYPGGNPFPLPAINKNSTYVPFGNYENFPLSFKTPYSQQWNLSVQRQLGADWLVQANYVGNTTIHQVGGEQGNPGVYIAGSCVLAGVTTNPCSTLANVNNRRVLSLENPGQGQYFATIYQLTAGGTANYNALSISAQHRVAKGYSIQAVYTWSHCISDLDNLELGGGGSLTMIPGNRRADRSNCPGSDRRQQFNLSGVYELPRFSDARLRRLASEWQISAIVRFITGPYMNVTTGGDQALTGQTGERPNQILADPYTASKSLSSYLNPAAFALPVTGTYGTMGNYAVLVPGAITINMGLTRTIKLREKYSVQFRFEAFNVPNHLNPGTPSGVSGTAGLYTPSVSLNNGLFGRILSANDPRILQGALKFVF
jgi:hypothetical protein